MDIFDYTDARKFLNDYLNELHERDTKYSARFISKQLGNSPSHFSQLLKGKKSISEDIAKELVRVFKFKNDWAEYFTYMCFFSDEKNKHKKKAFKEKLQSLNKSQKKQLLKNELLFHRNWWNNTIWAILDVIDVNDEYEKIASGIFPTVSIEEIKKSMELLKELELIEQNENGFFKPKGKALFAKTKLHEEFLMQYRVDCLNNAKNVVMGKPQKTPPIIYTNTISCSRKIKGEIIKILDSACASINDIVKNDESEDRVLQFQYQLFDQFLK